MKIIRYKENEKPTVYQNIDEAVICNCNAVATRGMKDSQVKAGINLAIELGTEFPARTGCYWDEAIK